MRCSTARPCSRHGNVHSQAPALSPCLPALSAPLVSQSLALQNDRDSVLTYLDSDGQVESMTAGRRPKHAGAQAYRPRAAGAARLLQAGEALLEVPPPALCTPFVAPAFPTA